MMCMKRILLMDRGQIIDIKNGKKERDTKMCISEDLMEQKQRSYNRKEKQCQKVPYLKFKQWRGNFRRWVIRKIQ